MGASDEGGVMTNEEAVLQVAVLARIVREVTTVHIQHHGNSVTLRQLLAQCDEFIATL